jgi:hypothetical protein
MSRAKRNESAGVGFESSAPLRRSFTTAVATAEIATRVCARA